MYYIKIKANHECWLASGKGDPPRTRIKKYARVLKTRERAEIMQKTLTEQYPNRAFEVTN